MSDEKVGEPINPTATSSPCDFFHHALNYTFHNHVMLVIMVTSACFPPHNRIRLIPNDVITLCLLGDSNIFEYCDQWRLVVNSHCSPFEMSKARQKPIW